MNLQVESSLLHENGLKAPKYASLNRIGLQSPKLITSRNGLKSPSILHSI